LKFFDKTGHKPRFKALRNLGTEIQYGGLLYISSYRLEFPSDDTWSDISLMALKYFLFNTPVYGYWSLVVYLPEGEPHYTNEERSKFFTLAISRGYKQLNQQDEIRKREIIERGINFDSIPFLRCGFKQAVELQRNYNDVPYFFASVACIQGARDLGHEATFGIITPPPEPEPELCDADKELVDAVHKGASRTQIQTLVQERNASIATSGVIQMCCVQDDPHDLFDYLVQLAGTQIVNTKDNNGYTPLMVAANCQNLQIIMKLYANADLSITDRNGRTAYGHYIEGLGNSRDFNDTFGIKSKKQQSEIDSIKRMLTPPNGPTEADLAVPNHDEEEDDDLFGDY